MPAPEQVIQTSAAQINPPAANAAATPSVPSAATSSAASAPAAASAAAPADASAPAYLIIHGMTTDGKKFRPSDWCDRLHNTLQVLGDDAADRYEYVHLVNVQNQKCILINKSLEDRDARLYNFFLRFCADNRLATEELNEEQWDALHEQ